jgi:hypothetical protein
VSLSRFRLRLLIASCGLFGLLAAARPAAPCDSSGCLLVTRGQNGLMARGSVRIDVSYRRTPMGERLQGSREVDQVLRPKIDFDNGRLLSGFHDELGGTDDFLQLDVAYGVSARAAVFASMPLVAHRTFDVGHAPVLSETYSTTGNGDALLGLRYGLVQRASDSLVAGLTLELPSGRHTLESPAGTADFGILDPTMQPGSGSLDLGGTLQYARGLPALMNGTVAVSYQHYTTNDLDYRFGSDAILSLTVGRPLVGALSGSVQVKGVRKGRSRFLDEPVPSTGGRYVYVIPGVSVKAPLRMAVYGYAVIPAYRFVNEAQLAPRTGLVLGLSRTF